MGLARKLRRGKNQTSYKKLVAEVEKQIEKDRTIMAQQSSEKAIAATVSVAAEIIYNHWRELAKKETRLERFVELFVRGLQTIECKPTPMQLEVERLLAQKCEITFQREDKK